jgi:hypothetical protein
MKSTNIARTSATASESCLQFAKHKKAHEENITILIHSSTAFFFVALLLYTMSNIGIFNFKCRGVFLCFSYKASA